MNQIKIINSAILLSCAVSLSGCLGTTPSVNSERPNGISADLVQPIVEANQSVALSYNVQEQEGELVHGTSCKNKLWDADPTNERALDLMKNQAQAKGFNAIHSIKVGADPTALAKNCWSAIHATGIAYIMAEPEVAVSSPE